MSEDVNVFVTTRQFASGRLELVLEAMDGDDRRWSKVYDGSLFLSMDAQSLSLLEPLPDPPSTGPKYRLKRSARVPLDLLVRMRFLEDQESRTQGQ